MAATSLDMQFSMIDRCRLPFQLSLRKLLYLHSVQMTAIFNFTMTAALLVLFGVIEGRGGAGEGRGGEGRGGGGEGRGGEGSGGEGRGGEGREG